MTRTHSFVFRLGGARRRPCRDCISSAFPHEPNHTHHCNDAIHIILRDCCMYRTAAAAQIPMITTKIKVFIEAECPSISKMHLTMGVFRFPFRTDEMTLQLQLIERQSRRFPDSWRSQNGLQMLQRGRLVDPHEVYLCDVT